MAVGATPTQKHAKRGVKLPIWGVDLMGPQALSDPSRGAGQTRWPARSEAFSPKAEPIEPRLCRRPRRRQGSRRAASTADIIDVGDTVWPLWIMPSCGPAAQRRLARQRAACRAHPGGGRVRRRRRGNPNADGSGRTRAPAFASQTLTSAKRSEPKLIRVASVRSLHSWDRWAKAPSAQFLHENPPVLHSLRASPPYGAATSKA